MGEMKRHLNELRVGESAVIDSFTNPDLQVKLLEMGCTPGETIQVEKFSPLGDPVAYNISGYILSMRLAEAATVTIRSQR